MLWTGDWRLLVQIFVLDLPLPLSRAFLANYPGFPDS